MRYILSHSRHCILAVLCLAGWSAVPAAAHTIHTVAGGGPDNMAAVTANLPSPYGVVADGSGNVYISAEYRVFKVDRQGLLTVVAGDGFNGFRGDGGPARAARFSWAGGLALDRDGHLFIADIDNGRVRRVDALTGVITTVAGDGTGRYNGDGIPAMAAGLSPLWLLMEPDGDLLVSDWRNRRIRRIVAGTGIIETAAGTGSDGSSGDEGPATAAELTAPGPMALDGAGNLLFIDGNRVRRIDAGTGIITTVAGSTLWGYAGDHGPARLARLNSPRGLAVNPAGDLFIGDSANGRIRRVEASTGIITSYWVWLHHPMGLAFDRDGDLLFADATDHWVGRIYSWDDIPSDLAGNFTQRFSGDGGPAIGASLGSPLAVAVDGRGNIFISDFDNARIRRVDASTGAIGTVAGTGIRGSSGDGILATRAPIEVVLSMDVDPAGNLAIVELFQNRVRVVGAVDGIMRTMAGTGTWGFLGDGGPARKANLRGPLDAAFDAAGNLFIADTSNGRIRRVDGATGIITTVAGNGEPCGPGRGDGGPAVNAQLCWPHSVAVAPDGDLLIGDHDPFAVRRLDAATGIITTVAGNGEAGVSGDGGPALEASVLPRDIAVDPNGAIFLVETPCGSDRIRRIDPASRLIDTFAGTGWPGFEGDGGPPARAQVHCPIAIDVDGGGNLYIADHLNFRVRMSLAPSESPIRLDPSVLWPPNHRMVAIEATLESRPGCVTPSAILTGISSSEPDDAPGMGDGGTIGDIQNSEPGTADFNFSVRAERSSKGDGRTYAATYRVSCPLGFQFDAVATVVVPHTP